ncbi:hypothetical protein ACQJBY_041688 [Aegilops geniculata]
MAALGRAATRLIQRAVVRVEQRRPLTLLSPRLIHTQQNSRSSFSQKEQLVSQIKQKKEELYDLIANAEAASVASGSDMRVLSTLRTRIKPRPHDPQWRRITRTKKVANWTAASIFFVASGMSLCGVVARPPLIEHEGVYYTAESVHRLVEQGCLPESVLKQVGGAEAKGCDDKE